MGKSIMNKSIEEILLQKMMKLPKIMKTTLSEVAAEGHGHESEGEKKRHGQSGRASGSGRGKGGSGRASGGHGSGGSGRGSSGQSMLDMIGRGIVQTAQGVAVVSAHQHDEDEKHSKGKKKGHGGSKEHGEAEKSPLSRERVLVLLLDYPDGARQKVLAEALEINASSASEMIGKLESDGYVKRCVDPEDKRATLISLTELGQARAYEVQDERQEKFSKLYENLTEEEKEELLRLLEKIEGNPKESE